MMEMLSSCDIIGTRFSIQIYLSGNFNLDQGQTKEFHCLKERCTGYNHFETWHGTALVSNFQTIGVITNCGGGGGGGNPKTTEKTIKNQYQI